MKSVKSISVENSVEESAVAKVAKAAADVSVVDDNTAPLPHYRDGKRDLKITAKRGELLDTCATMNKKYACCNVHVLKSVSNCPYDCSYCFLQNYLNDGALKVVGDVDAIMAEVHEKIDAEPKRMFRIGTWELGDSLALEKETGQASLLIERFSKLDNAVLELKTKSDVVDPILDLDHRRKTVVSWSVNPAAVVDGYEFKTASIDARLKAAEKCAKAGYLLGFHFDPMILHDNWEANYRELIAAIADVAPSEQIAWISMGSLRFNPEMKQKMMANFPKTVLTRPEMVTGDDGKVRYVKPLRIEMYRVMMDALRQHFSDEVFVYLCMERWDMWDKILGEHPESILDLDYQFAKMMYERFGLGIAPVKEVYL